MSRSCDICGRGPVISISRSHSHVASKRWLNINLQIKTIDGKRHRLCSKCLRTKMKTKT